MKLLILIQSGAQAGHQTEFETGLFTIGRGEECRLKFDLNERLVSKHHAVIERRADGFYLTDSNSTNGTFVNGTRILQAKLNSHDVIHFGQGGPQIAVTIAQTVAQPQAAAANFSQPAARINQPEVGRTQNSAIPSNQTQPPVAQTPNDNDYGEKRGPASSLGQSFANLGLYNPEQNPPRAAAAVSHNKYIVAAVVVIAVIFLALLVTALTVLQLGIVASFIATFVAFVPAAIYVLPLLWLDRYDPEPPLSLALAFAWGALVAVLVSFVINTLMSALFGELVGAIISAPIFEEGSKGLAVLLLLVLWRREFDGIVDGIVYAGVVALGFATVENVLYYGRELLGVGSLGLIFLFFLRGVLSPFAHVIFTSMTGIGCGISRETHNKVLRFAMPVVGYVGAVTLHAIWNTISSLGGIAAFLIGYVIFEFPFFLIFVGFAIYVMRRENHILKQTLGVEVAKGTITSEQMETATSAIRGLSWTMGGISNGKIWARRKFLRAVSKLGLAWWHISRANAAGGETRSLGQLPILEAEVKRWQTQI